MDNLFLDDFFDKFSNDISRKMDIDNRNDLSLSKISEDISNIISEISVRTIKKPIRFKNPRLYYRIDILSFTSLDSVLDDLKKEIKKITEIKDCDNFWLSTDIYSDIDENILVIKGFYRGDGMVSLDLILSQDDAVIEYSEDGDSYEVVYVFSRDIKKSTFSKISDSVYSFGDFLFSPDLKSKNPGNSKIYLEQ